MQLDGFNAILIVWQYRKGANIRQEPVFGTDE